MGKHAASRTRRHTPTAGTSEVSEELVDHDPVAESSQTPQKGPETSSPAAIEVGPPSSQPPPTPPTKTPQPPTGWRRQVRPRRAVWAVAVVAAATCLLTGLGMLAWWAASAPQTHPAATAALRTWQESLDGNPSAVAAEHKIANRLYIRTLPDGSVKASTTSGGKCYYLLVPADLNEPDTGIRLGTAADCTHPATIPAATTHTR